MTLTELADAVERQEPLYELFMEAWFAIGRTNVDSAFTRFIELLDDGAFLEAAMMLVPEGWHIHKLTQGRYEQRTIVILCPNEKSGPLIQSADCSTPAAALTAASLRAMEVE